MTVIARTAAEQDLLRFDTDVIAAERKVASYLHNRGDGYSFRNSSHYDERKRKETGITDQEENDVLKYDSITDIVKRAQALSTQEGAGLIALAGALKSEASARPLQRLAGIPWEEQQYVTDLAKTPEGREKLTRLFTAEGIDQADLLNEIHKEWNRENPVKATLARIDKLIEKGVVSIIKKIDQTSWGQAIGDKISELQTNAQNNRNMKEWDKKPKGDLGYTKPEVIINRADKRALQEQKDLHEQYHSGEGKLGKNTTKSVSQDVAIVKPITPVAPGIQKERVAARA